MCARHSIVVCLALLLLPASALAAEDSESGASGAPAAVASPPPERGLQARIPLAPDEGRLYGPGPVETADLPPGEAVEAEGSGLGDHLAVELRPTRLRSPNQAGQRHGHGKVVLRVPLSEALDLRTGVRVDYDSRPQSNDFAAEATPTIGVGIEF